MHNIFRAAMTVVAISFLASTASANPPIEAYGELPNVRSMALSPDGTHTAFLMNKDGKDYAAVYKIGEGVIHHGEIKRLKARKIIFPNNDHIIIKAGKAITFYNEKYDISGGIAININTKKSATLLENVNNIYPFNSTQAGMVGLSTSRDRAYIQVLTGSRTNIPRLSVIAAKIGGRQGPVIASGNFETIDWLISPDGHPIARTDYNTETEKYTITAYVDGAQKVIYETKTTIAPDGVLGILPDQSALIVNLPDANTDDRILYELTFDGKLRPFTYGKQGSSTYVITDLSGEVVGFKHGGTLPTYQFLNSTLSSSMSVIMAQFEGTAVSLIDWTPDFNSLLVKISGSALTPTYYVYNKRDKKLVPIVRAYSKIHDRDVGDIVGIEYKARDGLTIPAVVHIPPGTDKPKNLPLIVLPHGGPTAHDTISFNWLAQYFANRGYLVFQPNFRGSSGYGLDFQRAGKGEWGAKIQNDLSDGVKFLTKARWIDSNRVCIIGASFGGYTALAGGALNPELYQCIGAIASISDIPKMLDDTKNKFGHDSSSYAYWQSLVGDRQDDVEILKAISPARSAENFQAPVLLIHGNDDSVVPFSQSKKMERALKKAGKDVTLVKLKNEDHGLSQSATRVQALRALDAFVTEHIGQ